MTDGSVVLKYHHNDEFEHAFIQHLSAIKTQLFKKKFNKLDFEQKSLVELMIESAFDISYLHTYIYSGMSHKGIRPSFSQALYATTLLTIELEMLANDALLQKSLEPRLADFITYFSKSRDVMNINHGILFDVRYTCPALDSKRKIELLRAFIQYHCEPFHATADRSGVYFFKQAGAYIISTFCGIKNTQITLKNNNLKQNLDSDLLFRSYDFIQNWIKQLNISFEKKYKSQAIGYFAFELLSALGQVNLLSGKEPSEIQRGITICCEAFADLARIDDGTRDQIIKATCRKIFLLDPSLSHAWKTSGLDLVEPAYDLYSLDLPSQSHWYSLASSDPFMSIPMRAEALANYISKIPGMTDNMIKHGIINKEFSCIKVLVGTLVHLNNPALTKSFLNSIASINLQEFRAIHTLYDGQFNAEIDLATKLKLVQHYSDKKDNSAIPKLPFKIKDREPYLMHLLKHRGLLKPSVAVLLNLSMDDLHLIDEKHHTTFKRLILGRDLDL